MHEYKNRTQGSHRTLLLIIFALTAFLVLANWDWGTDTEGEQPIVRTAVTLPITIKLKQTSHKLDEVRDVPLLKKNNERLYTIKWGDTLTKIARMSCDTVSGIAKRNAITNASVINAGNSIKLKMVEQCSPESAKSKTFPEKLPSRQHTGAPREKSLSLESRDVLLHQSTHSSKASPLPIACERVSSRISDFATRTLARADCIRTTYGKMIRDALTEVDPSISENEIIAIIIHESKGNPKAISKAKDPCFGLMQLQGGTSRQYGVLNVFDPRQNILGGVRVYSDYKSRYAQGNRARGLASYNLGPFHRLLRKSSFDPATYPYVVAVEKIRRTLDGV